MTAVKVWGKGDGREARPQLIRDLQGSKVLLWLPPPVPGRRGGGIGTNPLAGVGADRIRSDWASALGLRGWSVHSPSATCAHLQVPHALSDAADGGALWTFGYGRFWQLVG